MTPERGRPRHRRFIGLVTAALLGGVLVGCGDPQSHRTGAQGTQQNSNAVSAAPTSNAGTPPSAVSSRSDGQGHAAAQPSTSGLPPCASSTATGCDKSHLVAGQRGSAACTGKGPGTITASPIAINDLAYIQPMGLMVGGHVTPIDHGYFYIKGAFTKPQTQAPVYAPMDGTISTVARTVRQAPPAAKSDSSAPATYDDDALTIEASCTFRVRFSNLVRFAGGLATAVGQVDPNQSKTPNYAVKAGELIGYTGMPTANGIDVWVENDDINLTGFINPAQYTAAEVWKTHMADFFDYTSEPLKTQLLALDERDASPRFGKIDYDVDGKLIGSWFRVGSGGYGGGPQMHEGYWDGHLAIVPDGNDPEQADVSFGNYQGKPQQFAVVGNKPDPATVSTSTGLVKYELGQINTFSGVTGKPWDGTSYMPHLRTKAGTTVLGTVLMQLTDTRSLKVEIFPGKHASQVSGFDAQAVMFER